MSTTYMPDGTKHSSNHPGLREWRVTLHEERGDKFTIVFDCWAEDQDHAEEQAENAYPACEICCAFPKEVFK